MIFAGEFRPDESRSGMLVKLSTEPVIEIGVSDD